MTYTGYQSSGEDGDGSVFIEKLLGFADGLFIKHQHMSESAVGKFIYDGPADKHGQKIVENRTNNGTKG